MAYTPSLEALSQMPATSVVGSSQINNVNSCYGMLQEDLAEKLNISRQAIAR